MSETRSYRGKLTKIDRKGKSLDEFAKTLVTFDKSDVYMSPLEQLLDERYEEYVVLDGEIYEVERRDMEDSDIFEMQKNPDGTLGFVVQYYDGGCGFEEAIETAHKRMSNE